ncbi:hypothetical protein Ato02nite_096780 [Paractinoplanes toevensis]|uniref:PPIase cyclophilin-type domain-containing protein n=1 Tax=Paractinoplanes toevensis TaxID=571911 RepID=A0A919WD35_9ACTN|nr:hypothetical protein Ato02nite_096780 [Actinoplanes toevensis]
MRRARPPTGRGGRRRCPAGRCRPARDAARDCAAGCSGTIDTDLGAITATVDLTKTPCTVEAIAYLASKRFWDNTKCHRLVTKGIKVLQCGDPTATGKGWRESDGSGGAVPNSWPTALDIDDCR